MNPKSSKKLWKPGRCVMLLIISCLTTLSAIRTANGMEAQRPIMPRKPRFAESKGLVEILHSTPSPAGLVIGLSEALIQQHCEQTRKCSVKELMKRYNL